MNAGLMRGCSYSSAASPDKRSRFGFRVMAIQLFVCLISLTMDIMVTVFPEPRTPVIINNIDDGVSELKVSIISSTCA